MALGDGVEFRNGLKKIMNAAKYDSMEMSTEDDNLKKLRKLEVLSMTDKETIGS